MYAYSIRCILTILKKNALTQPLIPPQSQFSPDQLLAFFLQLLPAAELFALPSLKGKRVHQRLFCPLVTLWYLIFQRLNSDHKLDAVVANAADGGADSLNPKLSKSISSTSTSAFSQARKRFSLSLLMEVLALQSRKILGLSPQQTQWRGLVLMLLDGSTVRLRPLGDIRKEFRPHSNQHRNRNYWCLMRVVVSFCALSGAVLDCSMGPTQQSEQVLACKIILRSAQAALCIGDRNFGVFRIVQVARHSKKKVLLRLTDDRARKLLGCALKLGDHKVCWHHSRHDQLEEGCSTDPIEGRLLVVRLKRKGFRSQLLCLFTTLEAQEYCLEELVELYGVRWNVELNLRYLKTQMQMAQLDVQSAEMARKEWLSGLLGYNLIRGAMLAAALQKGISPLALSFSSSRRRLELWLRRVIRHRQSILCSWERLLCTMARCKLPRRRQPRPSEPRAQRHLRRNFPPLIGTRAAARKKIRRNRPVKKS